MRQSTADGLPPSRWLRAWPIVAVVGGLLVAGLSGRALAVLLPLLAVAAVARLGWRRMRSAALDAGWSAIGGVGLALLVYSGASALWAVAPDAARARWVEISLVAAVSGLTVAAARALRDQSDAVALTRASTFVLLAVAALWAAEIATGGAIGAAIDPRWPGMPYYNRNACGVLVLGTAALPLWRSGEAWRRPVLLASGLIVLGVVLLNSGTAQMALLAGALVFALAWYAPRAGAWLVMAVTVVGVLSAPVLPAALEPLSRALIDDVTLFGHRLSTWTMSHRIEIWRFAAERIAEQLLLGWGLDGSRHLPGGSERFAIRGLEIAQKMPLHPHNAVIQIWIELGALGAVATATLLALLVRAAAAHPDRLAAASRLATIVVALAVASAGYGLWQPWWLSCMALAAAVCVLAAGAGPGRISQA